MQPLRTPEDRFAGLSGFAFPRRAFDAPALDVRMAYVDVAAPAVSRGVALCLHGQPTWSYLYRRMIPGLVAAGYRVIAPDLIGFGASDKPTDEALYTFDFHRESLLAFVEALDLRDITLIVQDWGGLLGLTLPMELPERFSALLVMNTALGTGDAPLPQGFLDWRAWSNKNPDMAVGRLMQRSCPHLTDAEVAAYDAPFPDATYKAGVRRFPNLVPDRPDAPGAAISRKARDWWKNAWRGRSCMVIGGADPVLGPPVMAALHPIIRACPPAITLPHAGHFVQEWGEEVLAAALPVLHA